MIIFVTTKKIVPMQFTTDDVVAYSTKMMDIMYPKIAMNRATSSVKCLDSTYNPSVRSMCNDDVSRYVSNIIEMPKMGKIFIAIRHASPYIIDKIVRMNDTNHVTENMKNMMDVYHPTFLVEYSRMMMSASTAMRMINFSDMATNVACIAIVS